MMMKTGPRTAFKMIEREVVLGSLEVLFDMPTTAAEGQTPRLGLGSMQVI